MTAQPPSPADPAPRAGPPPSDPDLSGVWPAPAPGAAPAQPRPRGGAGRTPRAAWEVAWGAAGIVAVIAGLALAGWALGRPVLSSFVPSATAMNPVSAVCFLLAAAALALVAPGRHGPATRGPRFAAAGAAGVICLVGLLRLSADVFRHDFGIDHLLFARVVGDNQIAPNTAVNFVLLGWALMLTAWDRAGRYRISPLLTLVAGALALLAVTGYVYRIPTLYQVRGHTAMALNTAVAFGVLSVGALVARPDREPLRTFLSDTIGGVTARRLVPAAVVLPLLIGWAQFKAQRLFGDDPKVGVAAFTLAITLVFGTLIWWNARFLHRMDLQRRGSERELRQAEAVYQSLVETLPQNIFRKDLRGRFTFGNRNFCTSAGRTLDQIVGRTDEDLYGPEIAGRYRGDDQAVIDSGIPFHKVEEHRAADGALQYVEVIKTPVRDRDGRIIGVQGIYWDVTERRMAEEELRRSRERYDLAVRGSRDGLWDWDLRTNEVYFSPRWKEMIGYADHEFPSRFEEWQGRLHPDDRDRVLETIQSYFAGQTPAYEVEFRLRHKDGGYRWILARGDVLRDAAGKPNRMAGSHTDITRRREAQKQLQIQNELLEQAAQKERQAHETLKSTQSQLVQTEKLAGLGQMVAGVAHEINNPLSFVSNNVAVLQRDVRALVELLTLYQGADAAVRERFPETADQIRDLAENIDLTYTVDNLHEMLTRSRDGLRRIQQIVKDLRDFARLDESDLNEVDLNAGIESTVNIIHGHAKKKQVTIEKQLDPLPPVACYPAKINQVVMNLISNAIDASPEGGTVTVHTSRGEDAWADGTRGPVVRVGVIDHGTGIPPEVRQRIFDPFFTTKPQGQGTGLGLSISYGIVQDHGGRIDVDSTPGKGSTFTIVLPVREIARGGKDRKKRGAPRDEGASVGG